MSTKKRGILGIEDFGTLSRSMAVPMSNDTVLSDKGGEGSAVTYNEGNGTPDTILMTGPMGEMYTRALSIYYNKKPLDNVSVESQAMDAQLLQASIASSVELGLKDIADAVQLKTPGNFEGGGVSATAFVVDQTMMNRPEIVDAVERMKLRAEKEGIDYVMVVNVEPLKEASSVYMDSNSVYYDLNSQGINRSNAGKAFTRATECYCEQQGIPVVFGLEAFGVWMIDKFEGKAKAKRVAKENYTQEGIVQDIVNFVFDTPGKWSQFSFDKDDVRTLKKKIDTAENIDSAVSGKLSQYYLGDFNDDEGLQNNSEGLLREVKAYYDGLKTYLDNYDKLVKAIISNKDISTDVKPFEYNNEGVTLSFDKIKPQGSKTTSFVYLDNNRFGEILIGCSNILDTIEDIYTLIDRRRFIKGSWGKSLDRLKKMVEDGTITDKFTLRIIKVILEDRASLGLEHSVKDSTVVFLKGVEEIVKLKPVKSEDDDGDHEYR